MVRPEHHPLPSERGFCSMFRNIHPTLPDARCTMKAMKRKGLQQLANYLDGCYLVSDMGVCRA